MKYVCDVCGYEYDVPLFGISRALGHSTTSTTTRIYMHLFDDTHLYVVGTTCQRRNHTMKYVCDVCGYEYDEALGDPDHGIAPGTKWEDLPGAQHHQHHHPHLHAPI